jgi:hypothetical protein
LSVEAFRVFGGLGGRASTGFEILARLTTGSIVASGIVRFRDSRLTTGSIVASGIVRFRDSRLTTGAIVTPGIVRFRDSRLIGAATFGVGCLD